MSGLKTDSLREQNKMISDYIDIIHENLNELTINNYANTIFKDLTNFTRILKIILTMKRSALYPVLMIHYDKNLSENARALFEKINEVTDNFIKYEKTWKSSYDIRRQSNDFIKTSKQLIEKLKEIINKEETELFPLIDRS